MAASKHPPGPPMDLANISEQGVRNLIGYCLNDAIRWRVDYLRNKGSHLVLKGKRAPPRRWG
jgi:hypothetical protein